MVFSCFAVYVLANNTRVVLYFYRRVWPPSKYSNSKTAQNHLLFSKSNVVMSLCTHKNRNADPIFKYLYKKNHLEVTKLTIITISKLQDGVIGVLYSETQRITQIILFYRKIPIADASFIVSPVRMLPVSFL